MKQYVIVLLLFIANISRAQTVLPDIMGQPLTTKSYLEVDGSPYLFDDWSIGQITLADGSKYKDVLIKYDEVSDMLYFQSKNGDTFVPSQVVKEFTLSALKNGKTILYHFVNEGSNGTTNFYELLVDGNTRLLKKYTKTIFNQKEYNAATDSRKIIQTIKFYIVINGKIIQVKNEKSYMLSLFADDKKSQLDIFIKVQNIHLKDETDLVKLINYYNSI